MAIGFFNCFADEISDLEVELSLEYKTANFFRCDGKLNGSSLKIDHLAAFGWCFVELEKKKNDIRR